MRSDQPFAETLRSLMDLEGVSVRELNRRIRRRYEWGSIATISNLRMGHLSPTPRAMENIAGALNLSPDVFAEYRLMMERRLLDPEQVGLRAALERLTQIEAGQDGEEPPRHPSRAGLDRDDDEERAESA